MAEKKAATELITEGIVFDLTSEEKNFVKKLCEEGTVCISLGTKEQIESKGYADAGLNGVFWRLKFGAEYTIPKAIARQFEEGGYHVKVKNAY